MTILLIRKRIIYVTFSLIIFILCTSIFLIIKGTLHSGANTFVDPESNIIVIDPGHGGIDGGATVSGVLEKDINLLIAIRLKEYLEQKGHEIVLTRDEDVSLEKFSDIKGSRQKRDLDARVKIINSSNARLYLSIHVNCNLKRPQTDSSIIFYNDKYTQNKILAYSIQRALNTVTYEGIKRTVHDPQKNNYYLLRNSNIPGVIVETAFISNRQDRELLAKEGFRDVVAKAIAEGVNQYFIHVNADDPKFSHKPNMNFGSIDSSR